MQTINTDDLLKRRQTAGEKVEKQMLDFLLDFTPARELSVSDVKTIANFARTFSFEAFSEAVCD